MGKNLAQAHDTSTYFRTLRVPLKCCIGDLLFRTNMPAQTRDVELSWDRIAIEELTLTPISRGDREPFFEKKVI